MGGGEACRGCFHRPVWLSYPDVITRCLELRGVCTLKIDETMSTFRINIFGIMIIVKAISIITRT